MNVSDTSWPSLYSGHCADCGGWFAEGTMITLGKAQTDYIHVVCPSSGLLPEPVQDDETLCGVCFTYHRGEC